MTKKAKEIVQNIETEDPTIIIGFGEDGLGVKGKVSKLQHVMGILALISAFVVRAGGDDTAIVEAIKVLKEHQEEGEESEDEEDDEPKIKIGKLDLSDKKSVEEFIELLKKGLK